MFQVEMVLFSTSVRFGIVPVKHGLLRLVDMVLYQVEMGLPSHPW